MRQNLRALQAFEAVSRHTSIQAAAEELGITPSAISHQIRLLTDEIGEKIVEKDGRGIILTKKGEIVARQLTTAFHQLKMALSAESHFLTQPVKIAANNSFCSAYLHRMLDIAVKIGQSTEVDIRMHSGHPPITSLVGDIFITTNQIPSGYWSRELFHEHLVVVCASSVAEIEIEQRNLPIIKSDDEETSKGCLWHYHEQIFSTTLEPQKRRHIHVSHFSLAVELATAGGGIALIPEFLVHKKLSSGELVSPYTGELKTGKTYRICCRYDIRSRAPYRTVIDEIIRFVRTRQ